MPTQPTSRDSNANSQSLGAESRIGLLRMLLDTFRQQIGSSHIDPHSAEEVLLDVQLDGGRFLLVRLPNSLPPPVALSPREQEIVRMVAEGHPNKVIAAVLNISCWTVCTHLRRVFAKLNVTSRAAMVARYLEGRAAKADVSCHSLIPDQQLSGQKHPLSFHREKSQMDRTGSPHQPRYGSDRASVFSGTKG